jgi:hypothetical protein
MYESKIWWKGRIQSASFARPEGRRAHQGRHFSEIDPYPGNLWWKPSWPAQTEYPRHRYVMPCRRWLEGRLVDLDPVRGARVRNVTADDVLEIYEMRALLEPFALEKAVPRMDENDRGLIRSLLEVADDAADRVDLYGLSALNRKFHEVLVARCDNKRIIETIDQIQDQLRVIARRSWMLKPTYLREAEQHRGGQGRGASQRPPGRRFAADAHSGFRGAIRPDPRAPTYGNGSIEEEAAHAGVDGRGRLGA